MDSISSRPSNHTGRIFVARKNGMWGSLRGSHFLRRGSGGYKSAKKLI